MLASVPRGCLLCSVIVTQRSLITASRRRIYAPHVVYAALPMTFIGIVRAHPVKRHSMQGYASWKASIRCSLAFAAVNIEVPSMRERHCASNVAARSILGIAHLELCAESL